MADQTNALQTTEKPKARAEFDAWLKRVENAPLYWNQSDAMLAAFVAGHAVALSKTRSTNAKPLGYLDCFGIFYSYKAFSNMTAVYGAAAVHAQTTADDPQTGRDAALEAVRQRICALPRYSFLIGPGGGVQRIGDRSGNWIEFDAAHELLDPVSVDAAIAAQQRAGDDHE